MPPRTPVGRQASQTRTVAAFIAANVDGSRFRDVSRGDEFQRMTFDGRIPFDLSRSSAARLGYAEAIAAVAEKDDELFEALLAAAAVAPYAVIRPVPHIGATLDDGLAFLGRRGCSETLEYSVGGFHFAVSTTSAPARPRPADAPRLMVSTSGADEKVHGWRRREVQTVEEARAFIAWFLKQHGIEVLFAPQTLGYGYSAPVYPYEREDVYLTPYRYDAAAGAVVDPARGIPLVKFLDASGYAQVEIDSSAPPGLVEAAASGFHRWIHPHDAQQGADHARARIAWFAAGLALSRPGPPLACALVRRDFATPSSDPRD